MLRKVLQTPSRLLAQNLMRFSSGITKESKEIPIDCQYDDLKVAIQKGVKLIDVREPSELKEYGKIPKSVNIPLGEVDYAFNMSETAFLKKYGFPKPLISTEMVLTCRSGKRATDAFLKLKALDYERISVYKGSFEDWVQRGEHVEK